MEKIDNITALIAAAVSLGLFIWFIYMIYNISKSLKEIKNILIRTSLKRGDLEPKICEKCGISFYSEKESDAKCEKCNVPETLQ